MNSEVQWLNPFPIESTTSSIHQMFNKCLLNDWMNSISNKDKILEYNVQISNLNTIWSLENRLPKCPFLQPGNLRIIRTIDFLKAASQLSKRNSIAMVAACVLSSLLERPHPLTKLRRVLCTQENLPCVLTTHLVHYSKGKRVNLENKSITASINL